MDITMYDSVTVDTVPSDAQAVAGYVGGFWPTYEPLVWRFPHALHLSIAINAYERARCLDVEQGDARPDEAPGWYHDHAKHDEGLPVLYASASQVDAVISAMASAGVHRSEYFVWSAHYGSGRHICGPGVCGYPQADGTQYDDRALGRNLDVSVMSAAVFGGTAIRDPHLYDRYPPGPYNFGKLWLNERATVREYDRIYPATHNRGRILLLRQHIHLLQDRIATVANWQDPANWNDCHRFWRWHRLNERLHGRVRLKP